MPENPDARRLLFVRTFKQLQGGGPVPPLGILYLAAAIRRHFGARFDVKIIDTGRMDIKQAADEMRRYAPNYVGLSAMSCEADLMREFAALAKENNTRVNVIAGGPHATIAGERLLDDQNIDFVVIGEGELTIVDLLEALEHSTDPAEVDGIAFRNGDKSKTTQLRAPIEDLDSLPLPAWDLIDFKGYGNYPNWNGILKEDFYAVMSTSRGCPFGCNFCHNIFGKRVRLRSPESVLAEMQWLHKQHGIKEIHFVDDVFNIDVERAARICELIIGYGSPFSLAFPNGLRADIMTKALVLLLKRAGTYKIHYGFETVSPRLQKQIGKNLDIPKAVEMIEAASRAGITTGAYFIIGFPGETRDEIMRTIDFASASALDAAYFFKATAYPGSGFYDSVTGGQCEHFPADFSDYHFYSAKRSHGNFDEAELNAFIMLAQRKFFMKCRRLWRGFRKSPRKRAYLKNLMAVFAIVIQSYLLKALEKSARENAA